MRIYLFIGIGILLIAGCQQYRDPITGKRNFVIYSTEEEVYIGKRIAEDIEQHFKLSDNQYFQEKVKLIGRKIAECCDRHDIGYTFKVIKCEEVNAMACPGGFIYITEALMKFVKNDDELACVIGHEVGHVAARHSILQIQRQMGINLIADLLLSKTKASPTLIKGTNFAIGMLELKYSRSQEYEADQLGMRYAKRAGYDPWKMIEFLKRLEKLTKEHPTKIGELFRSHPYTEDRIAHCKHLLTKGNY